MARRFLYSYSHSSMRTTSFVLAALAVVCGAFSYYGLGTAAGRRQFDEMAGILPLAAGAGAALFAIGGLLAWWRSTASR